MPNIAAVLKDEITRLARKEVVRQTEGLRTHISSYRSEIAALKRKNDTLEKQLRKLERVIGTTKRAGASAAEEESSSQRQLRFSAKRLATHRQRLGLSAADYASLVGASSLSIYKWEKGEVRPRDKQLAALASVRGIGKREAAERLASMQRQSPLTSR
jgi:DNA-binding transcriptional regulator YiaG